jgi:acyl-CoA reductase-like NAD-dependent aldehyde dehydrogenase
MERIEVLKTVKMYIGGNFPRTESGRYYTLKTKNKHVAHVCLASRKDFRNAVVEAGKALSSWQDRTAYNKSQIVYRIAEILEGRKLQFISDMQKEGLSKLSAENEFNESVDRLVYYAGWCDKYTQIFSSVNPVNASYFNFSIPEPMGIVAILPAKSSLLGMVNVLIPAIAGGNTCIYLANYQFPLTAINFAEVLQVSDLPVGVINILTGDEQELHTFFANHMDVNALVYSNSHLTNILQELGALNVKRIIFQNNHEESPYYILQLQEIKTTWHPIENIAPGKASY